MSTTFPITTTYEHIRLDVNGIPYIVDTTMKVVELVMAQKAYGWSPEELHFQHPYLNMAQHKETLDADIQRRLDFAEEAQKKAGISPLKTRLQERGMNE